MFAQLDRNNETPSYLLSVNVSADERWEHDSVEEFFSDVRKSSRSYEYQLSNSRDKYRLWVEFMPNEESKVLVEAPERREIETVFEVFDRYSDQCLLPETERPKEPGPKVFIGHGHSDEWRELKDHLQDKHGFEVVAYEIGERAGHGIRDILEDMVNQSSIAFMVFTGEDEVGEGELRARQNVVHETGLFQGYLGFSRAIAIVEDGVALFSNLTGIQQIRFTSSIRESFGDVLATLRREFPNSLDGIIDQPS